MTKKTLLISALTKFLAGLILMGLVLFLPAGTVAYPNAWLFLGLLFIPMLILGVKAPELLEKRLQSKEKESTQKGVVAVSGLMFIGSFVLAGLDFRFGWTNVPTWVVLGSWIAFAVMLLYPAAILARIGNEEKVLEEGLLGYTEYKKKVKYRLIPYVW